MKIATTNIILNTIRFMQIIVGLYLIFSLVLYILNQIKPLAPLSVHDFVVSKNGEIVIASDHDERIFIYARNMKLIKTFQIPEEISAPLLAIDENSMIYMLKGNTVHRYDMTCDGVRIEKAALDLPRNWRLTNEGSVRHFLKHKDNENVFATHRLRRIARPGDILFFDSDNPYNLIQDPFVDDKENKYVSHGWFSGINIIDPTGTVTGSLKPPLLLREFVMPFPGLYLIIISIAVLIITIWIVRKLG